MTTAIIKNNQDYESALKLIETLMDKSELSARESAQLDKLADIVEAYEEKNFPITAPDPVSAIKFRMEQAGLKQKDLIQYLGDKSKVSQILNGKRSLTQEMIKKLNQGLGIPLESLMGISSETNIESNDKPVEWHRFPVKEMVKRGWLTVKKGEQNNPDNNETILKNNFPWLKKGLPRPVMPKGTNSNHQIPDVYAIHAWQMKVIKIAQNEKLPAKFDFKVISHEFRQELAKLSYLEHGPLLAKEFLNKSGIHLIILEHLPKTYLDGAAMILTSGHPIIALTLRHDRLDNFWFVLFHELAHIALHLSKDPKRTFLEDFDNLSSEAEEEEANHWAQNSFIPTEMWKVANLGPGSTEEDIKKFATTIRINPAIPAGRIRRENNNYAVFDSLLGRSMVRKLFADKSTLK